MTKIMVSRPMCITLHKFQESSFSLKYISISHRIVLYPLLDFHETFCGSDLSGIHIPEFFEQIRKYTISDRRGSRQRIGAGISHTWAQLRRTWARSCRRNFLHFSPCSPPPRSQSKVFPEISRESIAGTSGSDRTGFSTLFPPTQTLQKVTSQFSPSDGLPPSFVLHFCGNLNVRLVLRYQVLGCFFLRINLAGRERELHKGEWRKIVDALLTISVANF